MRLGTFVLGGLVGAAAVIYFNDRKNRTMKFSAFRSPLDTLGKMMGAKQQFVNEFANKTNPQNDVSGTAQSSSNGTTAAFGANGLGQVQKIVSEDPELKKTVNDILQNNGKTSVNLQ